MSRVNETQLARERRLAANRKRMSAWKAANPDRARENARKYAAARRARDPEGSRQRLRDSRGMPRPTRPEPSLCECCGGGPRGKHKRLVLDHDHITGAFRGWLCDLCNRGVGMLGDDIDGILKAARYLTRTDLV